MKNYSAKLLTYFRILRWILHFIIIFLSFYIVYNLRFYTDLIPLIQLRIPYIDFTETFLFVTFAWLVFLILWIFIWIYEPFKPIHWYYNKFLKTWMLWLVLISFLAYYWYWFILENWISRFILIWWSLFSLFFISLFDILYNLLNSKIEKNKPYKILFLYQNIEYYNSIIKNYVWFNIYDIEWFLYNPELFDYSYLDNFDIVVTIWNIENHSLQKIVDYVSINWILYYNISNSFFLEDLIYTPDRLWPILAFQYKASPLDWWYRVLKRMFDIVISVFAIIVLSPLMILIWILIKIDSVWPVFYMHKRVWKNWKLINFIKFRSMYSHLSVWDNYWWDDAKKIYEDLVMSDKNKRKWPLAKIENDPRITKVWKILRKTSLDELPQLFLVLIWQMSLVWPRAHMPEEVDNYELWQKRLLSIKPWITWYAQIFWRDRLDFDQEAKLDLYYIQNWSVFLDLYVIITTIKVVFSWK